MEQVEPTPVAPEHTSDVPSMEAPSEQEMEAVPAAVAKESTTASVQQQEDQPVDKLLPTLNETSAEDKQMDTAAIQGGGILSARLDMNTTAEKKTQQPSLGGILSLPMDTSTSRAEDTQTSQHSLPASNKTSVEERKEDTTLQPIFMEMSAGAEEENPQPSLGGILSLQQSMDVSSSRVDDTQNGTQNNDAGLRLPAALSSPSVPMSPIRKRMMKARAAEATSGVLLSNLLERPSSVSDEVQPMDTPETIQESSTAASTSEEKDTNNAQATLPPPVAATPMSPLRRKFEAAKAAASSVASEDFPSVTQGAQKKSRTSGDHGNVPVRAPATSASFPIATPQTPTPPVPSNKAQVGATAANFSSTTPFSPNRPQERKSLQAAAGQWQPMQFPLLQRPTSNATQGPSNANTTFSPMRFTSSKPVAGNDAASAPPAAAPAPDVSSSSSSANSAISGAEAQQLSQQQANMVWQRLKKTHEVALDPESILDRQSDLQHKVEVLIEQVNSGLGKATELSLTLKMAHMELLLRDQTLGYQVTKTYNTAREGLKFSQSQRAAS